MGTLESSACQRAASGQTITHDKTEVMYDFTQYGKMILRSLFRLYYFRVRIIVTPLLQVTFSSRKIFYYSKMLLINLLQ